MIGVFRVFVPVLFKIIKQILYYDLTPSEYNPHINNHYLPPSPPYILILLNATERAYIIVGADLS